MCVCVCCTHLFSFFPLVFVLVSDIFSGFSLFLLFFVCFGNAYDSVLLLFVSFCCMHLHFMFIAVSNHCEICQVFFH